MQLGDWVSSASGTQGHRGRKENLALTGKGGTHLLHLQHVDAKVGQVLCQARVQNHVILIV